MTPLWFTGSPAQWEHVSNTLKAAQAWADARAAVLAETTPDVRTSESFRERLNALADAEAALFAAVKARKETT